MKTNWMKKVDAGATKRKSFKDSFRISTSSYRMFFQNVTTSCRMRYSLYHGLYHLVYIDYII